MTTVKDGGFINSNKFKEANKEARLAIALGHKNGKALKERIQHLKELEE